MGIIKTHKISRTAGAINTKIKIRAIGNLIPIKMVRANNPVRINHSIEIRKNVPIIGHFFSHTILYADFIVEDFPRKFSDTAHVMAHIVRGQPNTVNKISKIPKGNRNNQALVVIPINPRMKKNT